MLTEIPWLALTVISLAAFTQGFLGFCASGIVIAALLGIFLCRRVSPEKFRTAVEVVFGLMGLYLILQS